MDAEHAEHSDAPVAITGVGLHSAFGDLDATCAAVGERRSAVVDHTLEQIEGFPPHAGAPVAAYELRDFLPDRKVRKFMNPTCELAVVAAGRALDDAGLRDDEVRCADAALLMASGLIAFDLSQIMHLRGQLTDAAGAFDIEKMGRQGIRACHPLMPFKMLLNMPLGMVSIVYGIRGENMILYPGPAQAAVCLDKALRGIRAGRFERALVGGSAQLLSLMPLSTLQRQGLLAGTPEQTRPGDRHRGLAPTDAGAFVMLEAEAAARARGARVRAYLDAVDCAQQRHALGASDRAGASVGRVFFTGSCGADEDAAEQSWLASSPRTEGSGTLRLDPLIGHGGPAAIPLQLALACGMTQRSGRIWIAAGDPDGAHSLVQLRLDAEAGA